MGKRKCEMCRKKDVRRVSLTYTLPNEHVNIWVRFRRKHFPNLTGIKTFLCEECFFECHHGLYTIKCKECKKSYKMDMGDFYRSDKIFCAFCGKKWKE